MLWTYKYKTWELNTPNCAQFSSIDRILQIGAVFIWLGKYPVTCLEIYGCFDTFENFAFLLEFFIICQSYDEWGLQFKCEKMNPYWSVFILYTVSKSCNALCIDCVILHRQWLAVLLPPRCSAYVSRSYIAKFCSHMQPGAGGSRSCDMGDRTSANPYQYLPVQTGGISAHNEQ